MSEQPSSHKQEQQHHARIARNAQSIIAGLLTQCDTHVKISKHTDQEFAQEMEGKHKETQSKVEEIKHTINTTLDAQEEVPLFDAI